MTDQMSTSLNPRPELATPASTGPSEPLVEVISLALVFATSVVAALFAHQFREVIFWSIGAYSNTHIATGAARVMNPALLFVIVTIGLLLSSWIGRRAHTLSDNRIGLSVVASAARGDGPGPSVIGTLLRASGTLTASATLASLGREAAILETGGAIGWGLTTRARRRVDNLPTDLAAGIAAAGVAAAFAAAYHAPFAGLLYVEEHLRVRQQRRAATYTIIGAVTGHLTAVYLLGGRRVFSPVSGSRSNVLVMGLIVVVPVTIGSSLFNQLRQHIGHLISSRKSVETSLFWMAGSAVAGGVTAVVFRDVAGNGMEAIRSSVTGATLGLIAALAFGKMLATAAALGSGAPGGIFSPSMAVAAGWALLTFEVFRRLGISLPGPAWSGVIAALAIGIAIGLGSPLVAMVAIPEMTGDLRILPFVAIVVGIALALRHVARGFTRRWPGRRRASA